jgi:hypothetical protein
MLLTNGVLDLAFGVMDRPIPGDGRPGFISAITMPLLEVYL